jgi:indole-3-glycerol phosphate synthase/phosphoribosylanthranilate isomerase
MPERSVLSTIVERKRRDVAERLAGVSIGDLRGRAQRTDKSLARVLTQKGARFILEVKRASPSEGMLRKGADAAATARAYRGAADAISVLTDEPYFGGSLGDLEAVRGAFDGPVLAKDFFVDPRQVAEARLHGADAILVMLSVLGDGEAGAMIGEAERLGMEALVEVHDEEQTRRAHLLGARIVGINNRDLNTLEVDLGVTERLAPLAPKNVLLVSESGIRDRSDVERLARHVDAFLVGSSLMKAADSGEAARLLAVGRVKICGITSLGDASAAAGAGAHYVGLVFVPGSPRAVTLEQAETIIGGMGGDMRFVGVFANAKLLEVATAARALNLHAVQLHGQEPASYVLALKGLIGPDHEIWTASAVGDFVPAPRHGSDRVLFDTRVGSRSGGTGKSFDWSLVKDRPELGTALLAGGLHPGNAREATGLGAFALDVGSRIERSPGRKDEARLRAFFDALRPASREGQRPC